MPESKPPEKPSVFDQGVDTVLDTTPPPEHGKEDVDLPEHTLEMPGPMGDAVITSNHHQRFTGNPAPDDLPVERPKPRTFTDGERKNWTDPEKKERFASRSFRDAVDRDDRSR